MVDYEFSEHASDMLKERNIQEDWVRLAIEDPERKEMERFTVYGLLSNMEDDTYVLW